MYLLWAGILLSCVIANRFSDKLGMPVLLLFMALGMLFGCDGLLKISFDNYEITEKFCEAALIFIMFYGGFGTKWQSAKPVAKKAILLSTLGVIITAILTLAFCYFILGFHLVESFLIGAVVSSTDAASVFYILKSKKLSLKYKTSSLLEIESGSNDPMAYMLTMIALIIMQGECHIGKIGYMLFAQMIYGILVGVGVAILSIFILKKLKLVTEGIETIFIIAVVIGAYGIASAIGGNGYLSVYLIGIILGNSTIKNKIILVHFFDGMTGLAQIGIFFLLGLLAYPHQMSSIIIPAILIALFLTFIARPIAVFGMLLLFKAPINQCIIVAWAGLRGAASIVFAIMAIASGVKIETDLYHIVFMISIISVAVQGSLLPIIAKKMDMLDDKEDVRKTFNDYQEKAPITLIRIFIPEGHNWENKTIEKAGIPSDSLALIIKRQGETIIPKGDTVIKANDSIVLSVPEYDLKGEIKLKENHIDKLHKWCGKCIEELKLPDDVLIALIKRGDENIIPRGGTMILEDDIVVTYVSKQLNM